jgi:molybdopterin/thiamine biosynthesis adenylyltransferase
VHIIGCGGIGSSTALYLAKMGVHNITLWDFDNFEIHNLPNQMCRLEDIGKPKTDAVADIIESFEGVEVNTKETHFNGNVEVNSVIVMAVDSMETRKEIWNLIKKQPIRTVIDGRMGLTALNVYAVDPTSQTQVKYYELTLWDSKEIADVPCTAKATIFTAGLIASIICGHLIKIANGKNIPCEIAMEAMDYYMRVVDHLGVPQIETQMTKEF